MSISRPLLVKCMVSMISSMGPMACPFANKCWAKLDLPFPYLKSRRCTYNNNNIYLLQLGCYPVAVVILHVNKHEIGYY